MVTRSRGAAQIQRKLQGMKKRQGSWTPIANDIRRWALGRNRKMFATSGRSEGKRWAGYGSSKHGRFKRALVRKGAIRDTSLLRFKGSPSERLYPSMTDASHPENVFHATADQIVMGSAVPWAMRVHEGGIDQFGERFPGRSLLGLGPRTRQRLGNILVTYTVTGKKPKELRR